MKQKNMKKELDNFTCDTLWMSIRYWQNHNEKEHPWITWSYPQQIVNRFWGCLNENKRIMLIDDVERELEHPFFTDIGRTTHLYTILMDAVNGELSWEEYETLDELDFKMIRMAILYACPRMSIASATLPLEIIQNRYKLFTNEHKQTIITDLNRYLDYVSESGQRAREFSNSTHDDKLWKKFLSFLDENTHYEVIGSDDKSYKTFLVDDIHYSFERYIENPWIDSYILGTEIKSITPINKEEN